MELLAADVSKQKLQLNAVQNYRQSNVLELMSNQKCLATDFFFLRIWVILKQIIWRYD